MIIITKEQVFERIQKTFPNQPFEILEYERMTKPIVIKCLRCGAIKKYSSASNFLGSRRVGVCFCYNSNNKKTRHNKNKEEILKIIENNQKTFINFGYRNETKKYTVSVQCNKCNQSYTKTWQSFLKNCSCPFCENKQKLNTEGFKSLMADEYELLSEYCGQDKKILVKHSCGFIWKTSPHGFLSKMGCPKCNKKRSMGEQKISKILDSLKITYSIEQSFSWQTNTRRRYDFYLPEYNLIIEYMGEQHYKESSLFKISLEEQQEIDEEKRRDALKNSYNYLAINYKDFNILSDILIEAINSTTNLNGVDLSKSK